MERSFGEPLVISRNALFSVMATTNTQEEFSFIGFDSVGTINVIGPKTEHVWVSLHTKGLSVLVAAAV